MREIAHIRATMLGRFALQQTGMKEPRMVSLAGRSGRLWTLVAYLILHRDRGIPAQELIDLLWPDGSGSNPASTLQNNASRARNAMATLGFSDTKGMIRYENGLYRWVPGTDTWLDVDVFEDLARRALETSDPEELRTLGREAARLTASQELYGGGMGPAALETFLLAGDGESRALACDNGTFREIVLLYLRSMRRDPDLKAQLLMLCLEGWEAQPEKNAVYMQQMKLILQGCLRSGDPFTQIGAGQYWVLLPGAGSETHSAIAQRLQQAMHQRFAQSSAVFQTRAIDLRGMVHLAEPKD